MTDAPVRAMDPFHCVRGLPLEDGEEIHAGGTRLGVVATPGHTGDSVCFYLADDRDLEVPTSIGSMLTGDTIMGRGSPTIGPPDGSLREYIFSLHRLSSFGSVVVLPGHGPRLLDLTRAALGNVAHRQRRLRDVSSAMERLGVPPGRAATVSSITDLIYPDVLVPEVRLAAEATVRAQLEYLEGSAEHDNPLREWANSDHL